MKVRSGDRARAVALAKVIVAELKARFQQLLDDRAASMINELENAVALTEADLEDSSGKLTILYSYYLNKHAFFPASVKFSIEYLFPRT